MIKKEIITEIIKDSGNRIPAIVFPRRIQIPLDTKKVISLIGARRTGKTFVMFDTIKRLLDSGVLAENIVFFSCEDERLHLDISEMDLILQAYRELYLKKDLMGTYWFFDEIQNIPGWEKFIRRMYDTVSPNIFISGSNSKLLGTEIATSMRGRTLTYEIFPLSFSEYLTFKNIDNNYYGSTQKAIIINLFKKYLMEGGFPEIIFTDDFFKTKMLQEYYHLMVYHDLIERYNIQNIPSLKYLLSRIMTSIGKPYPINRVYNELKSKGFKISKNTLYEFVEYAQSVYLVFYLSKYDSSFIKQENSEKKIYWIDTGMLNSLLPVPSENNGLIFENAVYLYLRNNFGSFMFNNLFYLKNGTECDFVVFDRNSPKLCIQVCYDVSEDSTLKREVLGLQKAMKHFNLNEGTIITLEQEDEISQNDQRIKIIPAYKLFIDHSLDVFK